MKKKLSCVMLIDDNEDDNYFHRIILNEMDVTDHIQVAESGFEALAYLSTGNPIPELIFLDINMPKMNGWEFLVEYNKLNMKKQATIIIMLTTSLNPADKEKSQTIPGISGFETKPLTNEMLERILAKYWDKEAA